MASYASNTPETIEQVTLVRRGGQLVDVVALTNEGNSVRIPSTGVDICWTAHEVGKVTFKLGEHRVVFDDG